MSVGEAIAASASQAKAASCRRTQRVSRRAIRMAHALALAFAASQACSAADPSNCNSELAQMQGDRRDIAARANEVAAAIEQFEVCVRQNASSGNVPDSCRRQADD